MKDYAIKVDGLWKMFRLYHEKNQYLKAAIAKGRRGQYEDFWALQDVTFEIPEGEAFGIIGSNGSGKSTLLKCLAGILTPDRGQLVANGKVAALLELGAGFHPDLSGRENIALNGAILGMTRREIENKFDDIVGFAGLEQFIDTPVKNYSSGMVVRLGFAVAINVEPEILIIDEVLAVGDEEFQQRCFQKIEQFRREGRTIVFVSHGLSQVSQFCHRALWLEKGIVQTLGPAFEVVSEYTGAAHHVEHVETSDISDEPLDRWGTGEVRITKVALSSLDGRDANTFESGQPLKVRIEYEINSPVAELVVGLRITHLHGFNVFGSNTKRRGLTIPTTSRKGVVNFVVDSLPILEGTFDLTIDVSDNAEVNPYDHIEKGFRFNVVQNGTFDEGVTRIGGTWSI
ncbi:MAG: ABC transporter ATP-binding protein [Ilumatobacteraceae bacterium]|jgi:ABC-2 type transport system ATP-binding protein|nr:ABC transporter ATP-binding protein [Ilumatobacteraceae bacterium]